MDLQQIKKDGFFLEETKSNMGNLALLSLRTALKAYFTTYRSMHYSLHRVTEPPSADESSPYSVNYIENACSAVTNFQHFAELILKDILKREHILLTIDANKKPAILYQLLKGGSINEAELELVNQIDAKQALENICTLIEDGKIDQAKYGFIKASRPFLQELNHLRNRILHRGAFVLTYKGLDMLFSKYALPFLLNVVNIPEYSRYNVWRMRPPQISVNVLDEIVLSGKKPKYDIVRIALLKEIGRAAYENPIRIPKHPIKKTFSSFDQETIQRAGKLAHQIKHDEFLHEIKECPVCGIKSLLLFPDSFDELNNEQEIIGSFSFIYKVQCLCCTFEIDHEIKDLDKMGLPIENYWEV